MYVEFYMTRNPVCIAPDLSIPKARDLLQTRHFRHLPVTDEEGHLLGVVTDRDLRSAYPSTVRSLEEKEDIQNRLATTPVSDIMSQHPVSLTPESTLDDGLLLLERQKVGALPVVDENRVVIGIFSIRDLMRAYKGLFGLGEKGSALVEIRDDGEPGLLVRIAHVLEDKKIPFTRLIRAEAPPGGAAPAGVYVRVQTFNVSGVHAALKAAGLEVIVPGKGAHAGLAERR